MNEVQLIKAKIDIVEFISEFLPLKKAGRNFKALCPFHTEKTPSFIVSPERQSWHCFGCNQGGDVISFLEKWENIEFLEALKILSQKTGIPLSSYQPTETTRLKEKLYEINHLASEFFHYLLTKHSLGKRAREYLQERGIKEKIIKTFNLGYAPLGWENLWRFLRKKGYSPFEVEKAGLIIKGKEGKFYDRFRGRLIFPLKDVRGRVVGFSGRLLPPAQEKEAKYVNTPETPLYVKGQLLYGLEVTKEAIKKENQAILVEGEFDFLASFQAGVGNVVAIKGSALTEAQILLLKRYTENVLLSLDADLAGNEAVKRGIEIAEKAGLAVKVIQLLAGKDPAECISQSPLLWKKSLSQAVPVYDFVIAQALKKYNRQDPWEKKKITEEVAPFLGKISNPILRSHYVKILAKELEVKEEAVETVLQSFPKKKKGEEIPPNSQKAPPREELLEEHLLSLILQSSRPFQTFSLAASILMGEDFSLPAMKKIFALFSTYFTQKKEFSLKEFAQLLSPEITPFFDRAYLREIKLEEKEDFAKELTQTVKEIKKISLRRKINGLSTKIRKLENEGKEEEAKAKNETMLSFLRQLREIEKWPGFSEKLLT